MTSKQRIQLLTHNSAIALRFRPILQERGSWQQLGAYHLLCHGSFNLLFCKSDSFSVEHRAHLDFSPPNPPAPQIQGINPELFFYRTVQISVTVPIQKWPESRVFLPLSPDTARKKQEAELSPSQCKRYILVRLSFRSLGLRTQRLIFLLTSRTATSGKTRSIM